MFSYLDKYLEADTKTAMYSMLESVAVQLAAQDSLADKIKKQEEMIKTLKETNADSLEQLYYAEEEINFLKRCLADAGISHEQIIDFEKL